MAAEKKLQQLSATLSKMESALDRIEKKIGTGSGGGGGSSGSSNAPFVLEFDKLVDTHIKQFLDLSQKIGGDVATHAKLVDKCIKATKDILVKAATTKKPDMNGLQTALAPLSSALMECKDFKEKNRSSKQSNHLATIAEGISCLAFVAEALPFPFINDTRASSEFWSNRILKEYKGKEQLQVDWVNSFNGFIKDLAIYAKNYHTQGLTWA